MTKPSLILGIDTALGISSVSLCSGSKELAVRVDEGRGKQAVSLITHIENVLIESGVWYHDLDGLAVSVGPGGFTGIRVGLSAARALAHAANKAIIGFSSLDILFYSPELQYTANLLAILPAGREKYFIKYMQKSKMILEDELSSYIEKASAVITTIDGFEAKSDVHYHDIKNNAYLLCQMANEKGFNKIVRPPSPLYIRPVDAKVQKKFFS